jgi:hypothetical protein
MLSNIQSIHYIRLKRFDVLNLGGEEKLTEPASADNEEIRYYICYKKR